MSFFNKLFGKLPEGTTGLNNLGNTCYMNVVIQCLAHTPQLLEFALSYELPCYLSSSGIKTMTENVTESLIETIKQLNEHSTPFNPKRFFITFGIHNNAFSDRKQKDAAEFLLLLLDVMNEDLKGITIAQPPPIIQKEKYFNEYINYLNNNKSVICQMSHGMIMNKASCECCGRKTTHFEPFSLLQLPIVTNPSFLKQVDFENYSDLNELKYVTLYDCLTAYLYSTQICPNCSQILIPKRSFIATPPILIIQILRFKQTSKGSEKDQTVVFFPLEDLVVGIAKYKLYATIDHIGNLNQGHFTANCKIDSDWFMFNDDKVNLIDQRSIVSNKSYLLFYERMDSNKLINSTKF